MNSEYVDPYSIETGSTTPPEDQHQVADAGTSVSREDRPKRPFAPSSSDASTQDQAPRADAHIDATALPGDFESAYLHLRNLISSNYFSTVDRGSESIFTQGLADLLFLYGPNALNALDTLLLHGHLRGDLARASLELLGHLPYTFTARQRIELLLDHLQGSNAANRYAAAVAISALDDRRLLPFVEAVLDNESVPIVKKMMNRLRDQLARDEAHAPHAQN